MTWLRWILQGRSRDVPVVLHPGWLIIVSDGGMHLVNWTFNVRYLRTDLDTLIQDQAYRDALWEYLAKLYPRRVVWVAQQQWQMMTTTTSPD